MLCWFKACISDSWTSINLLLKCTAVMYKTKKDSQPGLMQTEDYCTNLSGTLSYGNSVFKRPHNFLDFLDLQRDYLILVEPLQNYMYCENHSIEAKPVQDILLPEAKDEMVPCLKTELCTQGPFSKHRNKNNKLPISHLLPSPALNKG